MLENFERNPDWNYDNQGLDWGSPCSDGKRQTPIELPSSSESSSENAFALVYSDSLTNLYFGNDVAECIVHYPHNELKLDSTSGADFVTWDQAGILQSFDLLQFHFHGPSEHTIDGRVFDLELHFVFQSNIQENKLSVLAILFDREVGGSSESAFIKEFFDRRANGERAMKL